MLVGLILWTDIVFSFLLCTEITITRDWLGGYKYMCVVDTETDNGGDNILSHQLFLSSHLSIELFKANFLRCNEKMKIYGRLVWYWNCLLPKLRVAEEGDYPSHSPHLSPSVFSCSLWRWKDNLGMVLWIHIWTPRGTQEKGSSPYSPYPS